MAFPRGPGEDTPQPATPASRASRRGLPMAAPTPAAERVSLGLDQLLTRRDLLRVASVGLAGSALPFGARAEVGQAGAAGRARARSVIVLWMAGGVTHIDSFDPKPEAPREVRGTLGTIATTLPGVRFSETLPYLA